VSPRGARFFWGGRGGRGTGKPPGRRVRRLEQFTIGCSPAPRRVACGWGLPGRRGPLRRRGGLLLERYDREDEHRDFPGSGGRRRGVGTLGLPPSDHHTAKQRAAARYRVRICGNSGSLASAVKERSPDVKPGLLLRFRLPPLCRKDVLESTRS